ncbi:FAD-binding oxidoreductase [Kribbella solani]|uniref:FAD-binding oxidoreductase n=1 Tax=Kribbella solani TaxID=236067 RepID=UPI00299FE3EB|nr:FAD-binding oxidoreductase [Kribbella solani]MDX2974354.1 FAD-binding oxidoreductase [Kribbella solani]MDX3003505.1 FAD-binding oxidoreductase [Kribbella solani]
MSIVIEGFAGKIVGAGDEAYDGLSGSVLVSGSPLGVLRPVDVPDVQKAVRYAATSGLKLAVRGGGHAFAGFGTNDGGLVIDLGLLHTVEVIDKEQHLVRIGGGANWGQVVDALAPHGLAISSGDTRSVGVGGLTLSGGIGWKVRKYGLALDSLVAVELVTASGELVRASADERPELFWAVRGGGGNFGVVTAFEFAAHPTGEIHFGKIVFAASEIADVLPRWAEYLRTAPDDLTSIASFANPFLGGPEAPLEIQVAYDGSDPAEALDPIRKLGTVIADDVTPTPYAEVLVSGAVPPPGIQLVTRSAFVDKESVPDVLRILAEAGTAQGAPVIAVRTVGGAVARVADDATAYAHRQAELMIITTTIGPPPVIEATRPGRQQLWDRLSPHVHGAYANFLSDADDADVAAVYPAGTYERLAATKRDYDPANLFTGNHNVRPV